MAPVDDVYVTPSDAGHAGTDAATATAAEAALEDEDAADVVVETNADPELAEDEDAEEAVLRLDEVTLAVDDVTVAVETNLPPQTPLFLLLAPIELFR